jgi:hypothetical protein
MAAFEKSHEKLGGRKKGTRNKGTASIKTLLEHTFARRRARVAASEQKTILSVTS